MVTKLKKSPEGQDKGGRADAPDLSGTIKDSAQQIWLAGLGAFAKAQQEGGKVFEALVKEGLSMQRKTQSAAEDKLSEATSRMASMASELSSKATELSSKATGQWDKLETIFEERVSRALKKLGVPTAREVDALMARVEELNRSVQKLSAAQGGARAAKTGARSSAGAAAKTARKRPAARKSA